MMDRFDSNVGARIRALREKAGFSREKCSEMAGIGSKFLYEIECGKKGMSAYTLYNIASALGVSTDYILSGLEKNGEMDGIIGILSSMNQEQLAQIETILRQISMLIHGNNNVDR
ncbi:MAG: helix-turn-helix transcriptional regulator [Clostridia bacterium]|nr:helix-turn-helix transcriptional regulator [Clostridia bacterium]